MAQDDFTIFDRLRIMLHQVFPDAIDAASGTQIRINCPLCKQSGDPDTDHHMYINLGMNDKPPMFNCFRRTGHSGLLTLSSLERLSEGSQYMDTDLMIELEKRIKVFSNFSGYQGIRDTKLQYFIPNNFFTKNENKKYAEFKRNYISNRLGVDLSYQELQDNKIVLNLYDFLNYNYIQHLTQPQMITDILNKYFIGFLTNTNTSIIFRNCIHVLSKIPNRSKYHEMRYVKYSITSTQSTSYYIIPTECDIYQPIEVHIAEGTFDILSIYYNLRNKDKKNKIYAAIGSKAYLNLIKYFLIGYGLLNVVFHVYIDSNIEHEILDAIKYQLTPLQYPVYIHINTYNGEKDFGVPRNRINEYVYKIC